MQEIATNVFLLNDYRGVVPGVIVRKEGTVLVDSPPCPQDSRLWRARCRNLGDSLNMLLVYLDAHADRTLGARMLEVPVVAHEHTVQVFRNRAAIFRVQGNPRGEAWERCAQISNMRWAPPQMGITHRLEVYWDEAPIIIEHHPGPHPGALWVILPDQQVIFVGDAVTVHQPPFLAHADLPLWIEAIDLLLAPDHRDFLIVGGREGLVPGSALSHMRTFLETTHQRLEALAAQKATPEDAAALAPDLLAMWDFDSTHEPDLADFYLARLRQGLQRYFAARYVARTHGHHTTQRMD